MLRICRGQILFVWYGYAPVHEGLANRFILSYSISSQKLASAANDGFLLE